MSIGTFANFDLIILPKGDRYQARVLDSPKGEAQADFDLPFTVAELRRFTWLPKRATRDVYPNGEATEPAVSVDQFGRRLYEAVFAGAIGQCLVRCLDETRRHEHGLRIRLRLNDVPNLAELPWEYLYATGPYEGFLALSEATPIIRYLEQAQSSTEPVSVSAPLHILVVVADPQDVPKLDVEREWRALRDALDPLQSRELVRLERLERPTVTALRRRLQRADSPVHILHFIGHGGYDDARAQGWLMMENTRRMHHVLMARDLAMLLQDHAPLRLVFLNACNGARGSDEDVFSGIAQALVAREIPIVIAMQFPVGDRAAIALAHELYHALAAFLPVDAALCQARKAVKAAGNALEWGTPVLFSRSEDNRILAPPAPDALPIIDRQPGEPETVLVPGGAFQMGVAPGEGVPEHETPRHTVNLPDYRIGKFPVTNREYAVFVKQTTREPPNSKLWFNRQPRDRLDHPVTDVTWHDAAAYVRWLSERTGRDYRLPTEAEWEKAARGTDGRRYPWGEEWAEGCCNAGGGDTSPVDAFPAGASPYSCLDLVGNVQEWTRTLWGSRLLAPDFSYPYEGDDGREVAGPDDLPALGRVVQRGGSYSSPPAELRSSERGQSAPDSKVPWRGFRVVMAIR